MAAENQAVEAAPAAQAKFRPIRRPIRLWRNRHETREIHNDVQVFTWPDAHAGTPVRNRSFKLLTACKFSFWARRRAACWHRVRRGARGARGASGSSRARADGGPQDAVVDGAVAVGATRT